MPVFDEDALEGLQGTPGDARVPPLHLHHGDAEDLQGDPLLTFGDEAVEVIRIEGHRHALERGTGRRVVARTSPIEASHSVSSEFHPLEGDLATVDDLIGIVADVARYDQQVAVRQLVAHDVGQDALALFTGLFEAVELIPEFVAMKTSAVANVEKGNCSTRMTQRCERRWDAGVAMWA